MPLNLYITHCFIYCIHIWSSTASANLKQITVLQKRAIRLIANKSYNAHTEPIFKSLEILPFLNLVTFFNLQFMQHYFQGFLPSSFNNVWLTNVTRHREDFLLALSENVNIPFARLHSSTIQPLVNLPRLWSQFEEESIKSFAKQIRIQSKAKIILFEKIILFNSLYQTVLPHMPFIGSYMYVDINMLDAFPRSAGDHLAQNFSRKI
jgi:hypothetical protein